MRWRGAGAALLAFAAAACGIDLLEPVPSPDAAASVTVETTQDDAWSFDLEVRLVGVAPAVGLEGRLLEPSYSDGSTAVFEEASGPEPAPVPIGLSLPTSAGGEGEVRIPLVSRLGPRELHLGVDDETLLLRFEETPLPQMTLLSRGWDLSVRDAQGGAAVLRMEGSGSPPSPLAVPRSTLGVGAAGEDRRLTTILSVQQRFDVDGFGYPVAVRTSNRVVWDTHLQGAAPAGAGAGSGGGLRTVAIQGGWGSRPQPSPSRGSTVTAAPAARR